jgi:hypothetical protein
MFCPKNCFAQVDNAFITYKVMAIITKSEITIFDRQGHDYLRDIVKIRLILCKTLRKM